MFVEVTPTSLKIDGNSTYCTITTTPTKDSSANTVLITLPAGKRSDYGWEAAQTLAYECYTKGYRVLWELQFDSDITEIRDPLYQPLIEHSVAHFTDTVYPTCKKFSVGVILGRFSDSWMKEIPLSPTNINDFLEVSGYKSLEEASSSRLGSLHLYRFMNEQLAADLQRAAARLPLELPSFVVFTPSGGLDSVEQAYLISPGVFEFIHPIYASQCGMPLFGYESMGMAGSLSTTFSERPAIPSLGVMLPSFELLSNSFLSELEQSLEALPCDARLIPEEKVVEMWEELETLVYYKGMLSNIGSRALQGFFAAGGCCFEYGLQKWEKFISHS